MTDEMPMGRLAFREEGPNWNAYYVPQQDSMNKAVFIGSIKMTMVQNRPERQQHARLFWRYLRGRFWRATAMEGPGQSAGA